MRGDSGVFLRRQRGIGRRFTCTSRAGRASASTPAHFSMSNGQKTFGQLRSIRAQKQEPEQIGHQTFLPALAGEVELMRQSGARNKTPSRPVPRY